MNIDEEYLLRIKDKISRDPVIVNSDDYNKWIGDAYPSCGSRIDWEKLEGVISDKAVHRGSGYNHDIKAVEFVERIARHTGYNRRLIVIPDGTTEHSLLMTFEELKKAIGVIVEFPQHTYIVSEDKSFVIVLTIDGYMNFAMAPFRSK